MPSAEFLTNPQRGEFNIPHPGGPGKELVIQRGVQDSEGRITSSVFPNPGLGRLASFHLGRLSRNRWGRDRTMSIKSVIVIPLAVLVVASLLGIED